MRTPSRNRLSGKPDSDEFGTVESVTAREIDERTSMTTSVISPAYTPAAAADGPEVAVRPAARAPSFGWIVRRALLGLTIMFAVTGLAAYIANASIDPAADGVELSPARIAIGTPAAPLLRKN